MIATLLIIGIVLALGLGAFHAFCIIVASTEEDTRDI